jgi:hypothetical protein
VLVGRRGRGRGARAHHPAGAALAVLSLLPATAALLAPAAARAAATQESLVEDERVMLQSGAVAQAQALDDTVALGADGIRAVVRWRDFAPGRNAAELPPGFDPADPGD